MEIEVLYVEDCPNVEVVRYRIATALEAVAGVATIVEHRVDSAAEAEQRGMRGSPTVLVDGRDIAGADTEPSVSCRLYRSEAGLEGAPTVATLIRALGR